jgi:hypothetical protein
VDPSRRISSREALRHPFFFVPPQLTKSKPIRLPAANLPEALEGLRDCQLRLRTLATAAIAAARIQRISVSMATSLLSAGGSDPPTYGGIPGEAESGPERSSNINDGISELARFDAVRAAGTSGLNPSDKVHGTCDCGTTSSTPESSWNERGQPDGNSRHRNSAGASGGDSLSARRRLIKASSFQKLREGLKRVRFSSTSSLVVPIEADDADGSSGRAQIASGTRQGQSDADWRGLTHRMKGGGQMVSGEFEAHNLRRASAPGGLGALLRLSESADGSHPFSTSNVAGNVNPMARLESGDSRSLVATCADVSPQVVGIGSAGTRNGNALGLRSKSEPGMENLRGYSDAQESLLDLQQVPTWDSGLNCVKTDDVILWSSYSQRES